MTEFSLLLFILTGLFVHPKNELQRYQATRPLMGVEFTIIVYADSEKTASEAIEAAFAKIDAMEQALSDYRPDSEISLLSKSAPHQTPVPISEVLYDACLLSQQIYEHSQGAFDITIGPASKLWRAARKAKRLPTQEEIALAKSKIGFTQLELSIEDDNKLLSLSKSGIQLDFGGIAKGLAADKAMQAIQEHGIESALINASGDILVSNAPPGKEGWTVQLPGSAEKETVTLVNSAVATSGDVYQFMEFDEVRYSHIINPKTANAITESRIVTVIHRQGGCADAYASAISVMGQDGLEMAAPGKFAAQIITATNKELTEFEVERTQDFPQIREH